MGIARGAISLLIEEAKRRPFSGSVVTLGKQTIYITGEQLVALFKKFSLRSCTPIDSTCKAIDDQALLKALGFERVHSFDYSDYEGATHVFDLNSDKLPDAFVNRYDVVLDSGTVEHIFHVPNVLKNIFHMVKTGGRAIFLAPSSNHMDHGFYMFSPTFFFDYYSANGFKIETIYVVRYYLDMNELWDIYEYTPGEWGSCIGGLDEQPYLIFFVATKLEKSTWDCVPQQGCYSSTARVYAGSVMARTGQVTKDISIVSYIRTLPSGLGRAIKSAARMVPGAAPIVRRFRRWVAVWREARLLVDEGTSSTQQRKSIGKKLLARY